MSSKDRLFLGFTVVLSILVGSAGMMSVPARQTQISLFEILDTKSDSVFEIEMLSRYADNFREMLSKDPGMISMREGTDPVSRPSGDHQYIHLGTRTSFQILPYLAHFLRGFAFVWFLYFFLVFVIKRFVVREFRSQLSQARKRGGRPRR